MYRAVFAEVECMTDPTGFWLNKAKSGDLWSQVTTNKKKQCHALYASVIDLDE